MRLTECTGAMAVTYRNRILNRLSGDELLQLEPELELVSLSFKEPLYEQGRPVEHIYFPNDGIVSLVTELENGVIIETDTVGYEGMVGLPAFFGVRTAAWRALCQIPGYGYRIGAEPLKAAVRDGPALGPLILRYAGAVMAMLARTAACNRAHSMEERMCRWLLVTRDRVGADDFPLTQEFLGQMLGARRPGVSLTGSLLQRAGLIDYTRGRITILDGAGLESASCECYASVRRHYDEAFDGAEAVSVAPAHTR